MRQVTLWAYPVRPCLAGSVGLCHGTRCSKSWLSILVAMLGCLLDKKKTATSSDGREALELLYRNREELKNLIDRLTPQEVSQYLADIRRTILGE